MESLVRRFVLDAGFCEPIGWMKSYNIDVLKNLGKNQYM